MARTPKTLTAKLPFPATVLLLQLVYQQTKTRPAKRQALFRDTVVLFFATATSQNSRLLAGLRFVWLNQLSWCFFNITIWLSFMVCGSSGVCY